MPKFFVSLSARLPIVGLGRVAPPDIDFSFFIRSPPVQLRYPGRVGARAGRLYIDERNTKEGAGGGGGLRLRPTSTYGEDRGRPCSVWGPAAHLLLTGSLRSAQLRTTAAARSTTDGEAR